MSLIGGGILIQDPQVREIDLSQKKLTKVSDAPEGLFQSSGQSQESFLEALYSRRSSDPGNLRNQNFATVVVNGETAATVHNNGFVSGTNLADGVFRQVLANQGNGLSSAALAQDRAANIAELLGGKGVKSSSAQSPAEYLTTSSAAANIAHGGLEQNPGVAQGHKTQTSRTLFMAQQMGQESPSIPAGATADATGEDAIRETNHTQAEPTTSQAKEWFLDFMSKSPEQRFYEALLREKGLTPEELAALPPEERAAIEEEIQTEIEQRVAEKLGTDEREPEEDLG